MERILLHTCCGPCSTVPLRLLAERGVSFAALYDNPNIQPVEEYERRRATFLALATLRGVEVSEGPYEPGAWDAAIGALAGVYPLVEGAADHDGNRARREARCRACYAYRFERLAARAAGDGFTAIATTLSISPYQFTDLMAVELGLAASRHGLNSAFVDYRPFFGESVRVSRVLGLYRQDYCGCRWSQAEATFERAARKAAQAAKAAADADAKVKMAVDATARAKADAGATARKADRKATRKAAKAAQAAGVGAVVGGQQGRTEHT